MANSDDAVSCSVAAGGKTRLPVHQVSAADATQQQWRGAALGSLFSGLTNCTVNISPQNFVVNVNPPSTSCTTEIEGLLDDIELGDLL